MRERIAYLDVIRIVACCMIVLMHSPHPHAGNSGFVVVPLSFITAAGIGLFYMVSGALLLPNSEPPLQFIRKRLSKVVWPTLFWSLFYLGVQLFQGDLTLSQLLKTLPSIPFSMQGHGILWFMYVLIGLYLLTPILSSFLRQASKEEIRFYLILWGITLVYPFLKSIVDINETSTGILYYFSGYVGYYVLGYYLKTYEPKISIFASILLICIPVLALGVYYAMGYEEWQSSGRFWYLSFFVAMMCVGWYALLEQITDCLKDSYVVKWRGGVQILSNCSFGVYLMHIFIMRNLLWRLDWLVYGLGGIGQIVLTWFLTLIICFLITYCISALPYSDSIIGYRRKR